MEDSRLGKIPPTGGKDNSDDFSSAAMLVNIRHEMYKVLENPEEVELADLIKIVQEASITCEEQCDLNDVAQFTFSRLFFDIFFMLASQRPDIATDNNLIENITQFWCKFLHNFEKDNFFQRIFCLRNAYMFEQSSDPKLTWLSCEKLIVELFDNNLLTTEQFEKQTVTMFEYEWESNMVKDFAQCLKNVIHHYESINGAQENFIVIHNWIETKLC